MAEGARLAGSVFGEPLLGTLAPGAPADICVLAYPVPAPLQGDNLAGHWVFGLAPGRVRDVYVAGELVVAESRSTRVDEAMVAASGERITEQLWMRLEEIPPHEYEPRGKDHQ
jgi:cytosine/adenosine deaminase-related metal-dependent hydrolase